MDFLDIITKNIDVALAVSVSFIVLIVIYILYTRVKEYLKYIKYTEENTFEKYKTKYPHLVQNGRVECNQCGSKDIGIIQRFTPHAGEHDKPVAIAHVCQTCGNTLYYSKFDK